MDSAPVSILYCPFPQRSEARAAAATLLMERLVACCNLIPATESLYLCEGSIAHATETILIAETSPQATAAAMLRLTALHPYGCPAILSFRADATAPFALWVATETSSA